METAAHPRFLFKPRTLGMISVTLTSSASLRSGVVKTFRCTLIVALIRRLLQRLLSPCVTLDGTERQFWSVAASRAPLAYRWFGRSIAVAELDAQYPDFDQWLELRANVQSTDRIWPFTINPNSMAMRRRFVVVRDGSPIGGIVTIVS